MTSPITPDTLPAMMNAFGTVTQVRKNRIQVKTVPEKLHDAVRTAQALAGCDRLVTISTFDSGETFGLLYHLTGPHRIVLTLAVDVPRQHPEVPTISDLLLPAGIYERQIHDLFGISFAGHPGLKRIILNEDWPEQEFPLRKDWKPDPGTFYGGIRTGRT